MLLNSVEMRLPVPRGMNKQDMFLIYGYDNLKTVHNAQWFGAPKIVVGKGLPQES